MCLFTLQPNGSLYMTFLALMNMTKFFVFIDVIARLEAEYQFWGVFCPVKDNHTLDKVDAEPPPAISSVEHAHNDCVSMDDSEAVDMEIDMVGGENVGRVDTVVSRYASKRHYELTSNSGSNLHRLE